MNHSRQNHFLRRSIATQFIGNDHARLPFGGAQQFTEEQDRCDTIPFRLDENIDDGSLLIHGAPEIVLDPIDLQKHLIQEPFVAQLRSSSFQLGGVGRTKFVAPVSDGFIREKNAAKGHHEFHIP